MNEGSGVEIADEIPPVVQKVVIDPTPEKAVYHYFKVKYDRNTLVK